MRQSENNMQILAVHLQAFINYLSIRQHGKNLLDNDRLPTSLFAHLHDGHTVISTDLFYDILDQVRLQLQDEYLGLRVGSFLNLNALGLIYQISLQATSVEEGLYYLRNFVDATLPIVQLDSRLSQGRYTIQLSIKDGPNHLSRIVLECVQTIIMKELRMMCVEGIEIQARSPYYDSHYPEDFTYGKHHEIEFENIVLKSTIRSYRKHCLDYLVPQYLQFIERIKMDDETFANKVKIAALNLATPALPKLEQVAENFNLSPRTFQRILAKEQLSFRMLTDSLNKELALLLLRHDGYAIADIGYLLGYAEPASFLHSFKKWYGQTPGAIKRQL